MKERVLVVVASARARAIRAALADDYALTLAEDPATGRALASTNAFLAVLAVGVHDVEIPDAVALEPDVDAQTATAAVEQAIRALSIQRRTAALSDDVGTIPYDDYIELARYGATRRYLMALLGRHAGRVTDAARGAKMKRESLHRLLRRHHLSADDFRDSP